MTRRVAAPMVRWWSPPLLGLIAVFPAPGANAQGPGQGQETPAKASIAIDAERGRGRLSPVLYGQFMEYMFEGIKGGLHAELLQNRSFEDAPGLFGFPRHWERYPDDRDDDPSLNFSWDDKAAYPAAQREGATKPDHSLRVEAHPGIIPRHGIYQGQIPVRQGIEYTGQVWLKTDDYRGRIVVALEPQVEGVRPPYAEFDIENIGGDWKAYPFRLRPDRKDLQARFVLRFPGRGRVWVDQVSLMPGDAVDGVRKDVFDRVKALRPAFVRWPGGNVAQDYHWRWGIGPRDQRVTWTNLAWRHEPEPSDFGTDEFLRFCANIGTEPQITVNVEGGGATPEEAAAWVEYCNGPGSSKNGALRAANGHAKPYAVKYWEVGNEIFGNWVRGHSDATTYAANFERYQAALRAVDPGIRLIAVGDNNMDWNRTVLARAGSHIDYLAIHHYYGIGEMAGDPLNLMARPLHYERFYRSMRNLIRETVPSGHVALAINEWGLALPVHQQYSVASALYAGRLMNVFERAGDLIGMSSVSDLVNGWPGGIIQANRYNVFVSPIYLVNQLYREAQGAELLDSKVGGPTFDSTKEGKGVPYLDVAASRSADGRSIFIKAVNTDRHHPLSTTITVKGAAIGPHGRTATIREKTPGAFNSFATPHAITIERGEISNAGASFTIELPAGSVSVLQLSAGQGAAR